MKISLQPAILRWARERAGLSVEALAKKMQLKSERVAGWEEHGELSFKQAEKLAKVIHTPFGYLYLSAPPQEALPIPDFRTVGSEAIGQPSPDLLDTLDRAQQIQSWFREELLSQGQASLPFIGSLSQDCPPVEAASQIRQVVDFELSQNARNWEDALRLQREHIEESGVLVMRNGIVGTGSLRGDTELKALLYKVFTGLASKTRKYRLCKGLRCFITR